MARTTALMTAMLGLAVALASHAAAQEPKDPPAEKLVGNWKMVKQNAQPLPAGMKLDVEVHKDSKLKVSFDFMGKKETKEGTWSIKGKLLTTTVKDKDGKDKTTTVEIKKLDDKTFIYTDDDKKEIEFEKVSAGKP